VFFISKNSNPSSFLEAFIFLLVFITIFLAD
jgi:hypothetical protein